ncbi:hypothetical protein HBO32_28285 [Pseudomonas nitroreducens]|uniref:restriction endonuclease subunit S n=1 Tax=Pseudomonas nitroreducens TaxID=46680 RepID=UPI0014727E3E|nr:restriction endonuclease subunit S [Pseudomonas nitroreducens]NMZ77000.1 hypothetical protein [Pseudomonas nitroreducens]
MSELWQTDQLGKYCYIKARIGWRGLSASEYTESGPYLIAGKHLENGVIDWDICDHISEPRYRESWEIALSEGDIILTKDGTIGRVARIDTLPGKATINGTMMLVRPGEGLDYRFLYHVLNGTEFKRLIEDKVSGSSIPHIFQRDMVNLPISFPPIEYQGRLADVLDTLDTAIRETESLIDKLKAVKQGLLHDLLTRGIDANGQLRPPQCEAPHLYKDSPIGWVPREWECETVFSAIEGAPRNGIYKPAGDIGTGVLLVGQTAFTSEGSLNFSQARRARLSAVECDDFGLQQGDLLVSRVFATREGVGQPVIVPEMPEVAVYESNMMRLRVKQSLISPHLLFLWLKHRIARGWIMSRAFASNQASINRETICSVPVLLPPMDEQAAILTVAMAHDSRRDEEIRELAKLQTLKAGLMDDLLTGRVRVTPLLESVQQPVSQTEA